MKLFVYFSELLGLEVQDSTGQWIAALHDIIMDPQGDIYPKATHIIIKRGSINREYALVPWEAVAYIERDVRIRLSSEQLQFQKTPPRSDFSLKKDMLDQQIVDTDNHKIERVNDIHLLRVDNHLYAAHMDVGLRALVRRLEWTFFVDHCVKLMRPQASYLTREELVPWKNTQILPKLGRMTSVVRTDIHKSKLSGIPSESLAHIMKDLDIFRRQTLFKSLERPLQIGVFQKISLAAKQELIGHLNRPDAADLLIHLPDEEARQVLKIMPKEKRQQLMRLMDPEISSKFRKLLGFFSNAN